MKTYIAGAAAAAAAALPLLAGLWLVPSPPLAPGGGYY